MRQLAIFATAALALVAGPRSHVLGIAKGPYLQNPTTDKITVCWVTADESKGKVWYGEQAPTEKMAEEIKPSRYHRVRLQGLKAYTRYHYSVESEGQKSEGTFITAAKPDQPFKFIAYGDTRTQVAVHAAVIARMRQFKPDFVLQSGDLVANGEVEELWDEFFQTAEPLLRDTPYFPALGNHERAGAPYFKYFDVPAEYSFDYGNTHFIALNTNRPPSEYAAQEEWLKKDLAAHQDAAWRVVYFHHNPYTCVLIAGRRELAELLRARLEPILLAGKVQLVLTGHDHNYQRHEAKGITYIVSGGGGAPLYPVRADTPYVKVAKMVHNFCEVTVAEKTMSVIARQPDGVEIDSFRLTAP